MLLSLWLMLLVLSKPAHAGNYTVAYSGGSVALVDYGNSSSNSYYLSNSSWIGSGTAHWPPPYSGTANAHGQIAATFTWQSSGPTDPPPASVIIEEDLQANWSIASGYNSASCSDGLGDAQVVSGSGSSSSGSRYTVKQNPGSEPSPLPAHRPLRLPDRRPTTAMEA